MKTGCSLCGKLHRENPVLALYGIAVYMSSDQQPLSQYFFAQSFSSKLYSISLTLVGSNTIVNVCSMQQLDDRGPWRRTVLHRKWPDKSSTKELYVNIKSQISSLCQCTTVGFTSFLSGGYTMNNIAGPPQQARQSRFGPCIDFVFQYALIRNNWSKKIWGKIFDLAWLKNGVAALSWEVKKYHVNPSTTLSFSGLNYASNLM